MNRRGWNVRLRAGALAVFRAGAVTGRLAGAEHRGARVVAHHMRLWLRLPGGSLEMAEVGARSGRTGWTEWFSCRAATGTSWRARRGRPADVEIIARPRELIISLDVLCSRRKRCLAGHLDAAEDDRSVAGPLLKVGARRWRGDGGSKKSSTHGLISPLSPALASAAARGGVARGWWERTGPGRGERNSARSMAGAQAGMRRSGREDRRASRVRDAQVQDYVAQDYSPRLRPRNCVIYTYGTGQPAHAVWGTQDNVKVRCERKRAAEARRAAG